jgi:hypothetical protein
VHVFGAGTTLFSILVSGALYAATVQLSPASLTGMTQAALLVLPVVLIKTGFPDYLAPGPKFSHTIISVGAVASAGLGLLLQQNASGMFRVLLLGAIVASAAALLLRAVEQKHAVLGPFYHFERRASVLTVSTSACGNYCRFVACAFPSEDLLTK